MVGKDGASEMASCMLMGCPSWLPQRRQLLALQPVWSSQKITEPVCRPLNLHTKLLPHINLWNNLWNNLWINYLRLQINKWPSSILILRIKQSSKSAADRLHDQQQQQKQDWPWQQQDQPYNNNNRDNNNNNNNTQLLALLMSHTDINCPSNHPRDGDDLNLLGHYLYLGLVVKAQQK